MTKAQELQEARDKRGVKQFHREWEDIQCEETVESFYQNIITDEEIEEALKNYQDNYDEILNQFLEKTRLQKTDLAFLFIGVMLQCIRIYGIDKLFIEEKANMHGGREDKIHRKQKYILKKFGLGENPNIAPLYASFDYIISTVNVPYDATKYKNKKLGLFAGGNHRYSTLGHDPIAGLLFGTANILTNTITVCKKGKIDTYCVEYNEMLRDPRIASYVRTIPMLLTAMQRMPEDTKSVVAAVLKQLIHVWSDLFTPCGIPLPGYQFLYSTETVHTITQYVSTGDIIKVGTSAGLSGMINTIIASIHGSAMFFQSEGSSFEAELYQARTRKILMYSNVIASSSNLLTVALTNSIQNLDIGGLLIILYRMFQDIKFLSKLEYEFINSKLNVLYDQKYAEISEYYDY